MFPKLRLIAYRLKRLLRRQIHAFVINFVPELLRFTRWTQLTSLPIWPPRKVLFDSPYVHHPSNEHRFLFRSHWLFSVYKPTLPSASLHELIDATLFVGSGMIAASNGALLLDAAKTIEMFKDYVEVGSLRRRGAHRVKDKRPRSTIMIGSQSNNWYHWIVDALPRLYGLSLLDEEIVLAVPKSLTGARLEALERTKPRNVSLEILPDGQVRVPRLIFSPLLTIGGFGMVRPEAFEALYPRLVNSCKSSGSTPRKRIYLSRKGEMTRQIDNEESLLSALRPFGFCSVNPGDLSLCEQVQLFAAAETVIGMHGANLTGIAFTHSATLIEIHPLNLCYYGLAISAKAKYIPILWEKVSNHSRNDARTKADHSGPVEVNIEKVLEAVSQACSIRQFNDA
jgi:capsular polysaccharide biosynthesis protein